MTPYPFALVTPQGKIFEEAIAFLSAPGFHGRFGVMARHAPMISVLRQGMLKVQGADSVRFFNIGSGILEVSMTGRVMILADFAQAIDQPQELKETITI